MKFLFLQKRRSSEGRLKSNLQDRLVQLNKRAELHLKTARTPGIFESVALQRHKSVFGSYP